MSFTPTAKKLFRAALPAKEGGHILALREYHDAYEHLQLLTNNIKTLKRDHRVGVIGFESAIFMNLFEWAYRDGKLAATPEEAQQQMEDVYQAYARLDFIKNLYGRSNLSIAAHKNGMDIFHFDGRQLPLMERLKTASPELINDFQQKGFDATTPYAKIVTGYATDPDQSVFKMYWLLLKAKKLYDENPEYRTKLDAIESTITTLLSKNIPIDVISANIMAQYASKTNNAISISGTYHLGGFKSERDRLQGIFDEGLAGAGWKVTDGWIATTHTHPNHSWTEIGFGDGLGCDNFDSMDWLYLIDTNKVRHFPEKIDRGRGNFIIKEDTYSCSYAPPVETKYSPEQLDPRRVPGLNEALDDLRAALAANDSPPSASSRPKHQRQATGQTP